MFGWLKGFRLAKHFASNSEVDIDLDLEIVYHLIKHDFDWIDYNQFVNVFYILHGLYNITQHPHVRNIHMKEQAKGVIIVPKYFLKYLNIDYRKYKPICESLGYSSEVLTELSYWKLVFVPAARVDKIFKPALRDKKYKFIGLYNFGLEGGIEFYELLK